jgi:DNA-binding CsgD family transcriptional regulator
MLTSEGGTWLIERGLTLAAQASGRANATRLRTPAPGLVDGQPLLAIREPEAPADAMQALLLLRPADAPAFGARERRLTERLAPHAMQALATARTLLDARQRAADPPAGADHARSSASTASTAPAAASPIGALAIDPPAGPAGAVAELSPIERTVARLYAAGHTDREITERLGLPPGAVREHLRRVFAVLGVASRAQVGVLLG